MSFLTNLIKHRVARFNDSGNTVLVGADGNIPLFGISCEQFGVSPSATAAVNTAAIQEALDAAAAAGGGLVTLQTPGTYMIVPPLRIGSNTTLFSGPGVVYKNIAMTQNGATCTATVSGGAVTAVTVTNAAGSGCYTETPKIHLTGGAVRKAKLRAVTTSGVVSSVVIEDGGLGYSVAPTIELLDKPYNVATGVEAVLTATISGGRVTGVTIVNGGSGYLNPGGATISPRLRVRGVAGPTATATLNANGTLASVAVVQPGAGLVPAGHVYAANGVLVSISGRGVSACYMLTNSDWDNGNENIKVIGGEWDYQNNGYQRTGLNQHCMIFNDVYGLEVAPKAVRNVAKYACFIASCTDVDVHGIEFATFSDCVHVLGPSDNIRVRDVYGNDGEGIAIMQCVDYTAFALSEGRIRNYSIKNVRMDGGYAGVSLYPDYNTVDATTYEFTGAVDGITGLMIGKAIEISSANALTDVKSAITVRGVNAKMETSNPSFSMLWIGKGRYRNITFRDATHNCPNGVANKGILDTANDAVIDKITFDNLTSLAGYSGAPGGAALSFKGHVYDITLMNSNLVFTTSGLNRVFETTYNSLKTFTVENAYIEGMNRILQNEIAGANVVITLNNVSFKGQGYPLNLRGTSKVIINGGKFDTISTAVIRSVTAGDVVSLYGGGWSLVSASIATAASIANTATLVPYTFNFSADTTAAWIAGVAGAHCYGTNGTPSHRGYSTAWNAMY